MDKNIYELQNYDLIVQALAVQSKLYSKAKRLNYLNFVLCVLLPVAYTFAKPLLKSELLLSLGIIFTVLLVFISTIIRKTVLKLCSSAAKVQQTIDYYLFEDDNFKSRNDNWGELYSRDELIYLISKMKIIEKNVQSKKNWYSDYSSLPHVQQSYYSQCESVRWDEDLRKKFITVLCTTALFVCIVIILIAVAIKMTIFEFIVCIGTLIPVIKFVLPLKDKLNNDIKRLQNIKHLQSTIKNSLAIAIGGEELYSKEIRIQSMLYEHRKTALLIPDWFYKLFKNKQESIENQIAKKKKEEIDKYDF